MNPLKTLLVEDHPLYREGLVAILEKHPEISVEGQASSVDEGLELLKCKQYDFIITDICLPQKNGMELTQIVRQNYPEIKILILSMRVGRELVQQAIKLDVNGYILKKSGKAEFFKAIDAIIAGKIHYSSEITSYVFDILNTGQKGYISNILTRREQEILHLIANQYSNKEIAEKLYVSVSTVETHRSKMFDKTNSKCVVGLIRYAVENDLLEW